MLTLDSWLRPLQIPSDVFFSYNNAVFTCRVRVKNLSKKNSNKQLLCTNTSIHEFGPPSFFSPASQFDWLIHALPLEKLNIFQLSAQLNTTEPQFSLVTDDVFPFKVNGDLSTLTDQRISLSQALHTHECMLTQMCTHQNALMESHIDVFLFPWLMHGGSCVNLEMLIWGTDRTEDIAFLLT